MITTRPANSVVVFDFETSGLSPAQGHRTIEVGAVLLENGKVTDRFQALMNPGIRIDNFIENYTGITNAMLAEAEPASVVMSRFGDFIEGHNLVAHNASFDQRFLQAELQRLQRTSRHAFSCSLLAARRIYQTAPGHSLAALVAFKQLPQEGDFHRALGDAQMTAHLWLALLEDIHRGYQFDEMTFSAMQQLTTIPKRSVLPFFQALRRQKEAQSFPAG